MQATMTLLKTIANLSARRAPWRLFPAVALCVVTLAASGEPNTSYPDRPIRIVVPFPPAGSTDVLARTLAEGLRVQFNQPVVVENKAGAGGLIGSEAVKQSPPDGYTLLLTSLNNHIMAPLIQGGKFQPQRDLASVGLAVTANTVLAVSNQTNVSTVKEFVAFARRQPGRVLYSSSGNGSFGHFFSEVFRTQADVPLVHIPYRGAAPSVIALMNDEVQMLLIAYSAIQGQAEAGKVRILAQDGTRRSALLPNVPTFSEAGYPGFEPTFWLGISVPKRTPEAIIAKLNHALTAILKSPEFEEKARKSAWTPLPGSPGDMDKRVDLDIKRYAEIVKRLNIKPE